MWSDCLLGLGMDFLVGGFLVNHEKKKVLYGGGGRGGAGKSFVVMGKISSYFYYSPAL